MNNNDIKNKAEQYLSAWSNRIHRETNETDVSKYVTLCLKISELMSEYRTNCFIDFKSHKIKLRNKRLSDLQLAAVEYILENKEFVKDHVSLLVKRWTGNLEVDF